MAESQEKYGPTEAGHTYSSIIGHQPVPLQAPTRKLQNHGVLAVVDNLKGQRTIQACRSDSFYCSFDD